MEWGWWGREVMAQLCGAAVLVWPLMMPSILAAPLLAGRERPAVQLRDEIPSPADPPSGCVFRTRCPFALPRCAEETPPLRPVGEGRQMACLRDDLVF